MTNLIDVRGLDKAAVLAALYNGASPKGLGVMQFDPEPMTTAEAEKILALSVPGWRFDYLKGRVLKVTLDGDELDPRLYDRDNGAGAAARAIAALR